MKFAALMVLAAAVGGMTAMPAMAQTRPAITQNRDEPGRNPYYVQGSCNTVTFTFCEIKFNAVPAGNRLVVTYTSILNLMPSANMITSMDLRKYNGTIQAFLPSTLYPATSPTFNYFTSANILAYYEAGEIPALYTFTNSNTSFQMVGTLSGYLVQLP